MKVRGSNRYKFSLVDKAFLEREEELPIQLKFEKKIIDDVLSILD